MEETSDYIDAMKDADRKLYGLMRRFRRTTQLNEYLRDRSGFQFPVLMDNTLEDIVAYYLSMIDVDSPDDAPASTEQERLGEYIEGYFAPYKEGWERLALRLLDSRLMGTSLSPVDEYLIHLLKLVKERDGPWVLCDYFYSVMNILGRRHHNRRYAKEMYELFADLGLTDCLIYHHEYLGKLIDTVTDKAAEDFEYFKWITIARKGYEEFDHDPDGYTRHLCILMTLSKLTQYSSSKGAFDRRFRSYVRHILSDASPEDILAYLFRVVAVLLLTEPEEGFPSSLQYLQYMVKALAYAEQVYGVSLLSALGVVGERQVKVLKILAGTR